MGKWMFAFAVVGVIGFFAESAQAQELITTAPKVVASPETVTMTPRRGILGRARERRGMTVVSQSSTMSTVAATTTTPGSSGIVQAQGTRTPGSSGVVQAQATVPANTMATPTQTVEPRQGLFGRLRARRGL